MQRAASSYAAEEAVGPGESRHLDAAVDYTAVAVVAAGEDHHRTSSFRRIKTVKLRERGSAREREMKKP